MPQPRGFTLIEVLVVIAIIALLSGVVFAAMKSAREKARDTQRVTNARQLGLALEQYELTNGTYKVAGAGLSSNPGSGYAAKDTGAAGYLNSITSTLKSGSVYSGDTLHDPVFGTDNYYIGQCATTSGYAIFLKVEQEALKQSSTTIQAACGGTEADTEGFNYIAYASDGLSLVSGEGQSITSGLFSGFVQRTWGYSITAAALSCASSASGTIYCFGGDSSSGTGQNLSTIIGFNAVTGTRFFPTASLPSARAYFSCVGSAVTGKIYCFGGIATNWADRFNAIVIFDPAVPSAVNSAYLLPSKRHALSCARNPQTDKIYCFGGFDASGYLDQITEFTPATGQVSIMNAKLPTPRYYTSCAAVNTGKIYCFGGHNGATYYSDVYEYDPVSDVGTIKSGISLPSSRRAATCSTSVDGNTIYCFGGHDGAAYRTDSFFYNPSANVLNPLSFSLPTGMAFSSCLPDPLFGKVLCYGGQTTNGATSSQYYVE